MIKVLHQVLDPSGIGGVSAEFRALKNSSLSNKYEFSSMVLSEINGGLNLKTIKFYYTQIKKIRPDIIHIRGAAIDSLNAIIAAKLACCGKIMVAVHGMYSDLIYISKYKHYISKHIIEPLIFKLSDGISCVCKSANDRRMFDKYRHKMLPYVYNRIPYYDLSQQSYFRSCIRSKLCISDNDIIGLFAGRITLEKGLKVLLSAFRKYNIWPKNLYFIIVGDGPFLADFKKEAESISTNIICVGASNEVNKYLLASDFFIMPSLHENHSIALLEAMAAKLPTIATNIGGNQEIIEQDKTGQLIPINDPDAIYNGIQNFLIKENLNLYRQNIANYDFSKFSNENCDSALDLAYTKLLSK